MGTSSNRKSGSMNKEHKEVAKADTNNTSLPSIGPAKTAEKDDEGDEASFGGGVTMSQSQEDEEEEGGLPPIGIGATGKSGMMPSINKPNKPMGVNYAKNPKPAPIGGLKA